MSGTVPEERTGNLKILEEEMIRLGDVHRHIPGSASPQTIYRWANTGLRGISLETVYVGGARFTSRQAITRFLEAINKRKES